MYLKASSSPWMSKWSTISGFVATASVVQEFPIQALPVSNHIQSICVYNLEWQNNFAATVLLGSIEFHQSRHPY
jgi:hypothetical protein